jgi:phasin family protein
MAKDPTTSTSTEGANPFGDLTKMLEQFKVPGVDMSSFIDARRKDVEALVAANKAAYEAMQGLARTQTDMLTQAMQSLQESTRDMTTGKGGTPDPAKMAEGARTAWQKMLADMKTLAEMAQKSQTEAVASMTARTSEGMKEVKQMMAPK